MQQPVLEEVAPRISSMQLWTLQGECMGEAVVTRQQDKSEFASYYKRCDKLYMQHASQFTLAMHAVLQEGTKGLPASCSRCMRLTRNGDGEVNCACSGSPH